MKILNAAVSVLLSFSLCCIPMPVQALETAGFVPAENQCGDRMTWSYDGNGVLTISGSGAMWDYTPFAGSDYDLDDDALPDYLKDFAPWSKHQYEIREVRFEGSVEKIGSYAFLSLQQLGEITLPSSVREIGNDAFSDCRYLHSVVFPDGLTGIGSHAFSGTALTEVSLPDSVLRIGECAFYDNDALKSVTLREGLLSVGSLCFGCCPELTDITFPESAETFGSGILMDDYAWLQAHESDEYVLLNSRYLYRYNGSDGIVVIPEGVTQLDPMCFSFLDKSYFDGMYHYFEAWREDIQVIICPDSLTELPEEMFSYFGNLRKLHFGAGIRQIPKQLCMGCEALTDVELPDGLQVISEQAFSGCISLTTLRIPETVEQIGMDALYQTPFSQQGDFVICGNGLLVYYNGNQSVLAVPDGVKTICTNAFNYSAAVSVTLPESVRKLEKDCFRSSMLMEVYLNDGLTEIPEDVFSFSSHLFLVRIPESVTVIDPHCCAGQRFTVIGTRGSAAEQYANQEQLPFSEENSLSEGPDMTLDPAKECWSFKNNTTSFTARNYLLDEDRALLEQAEIKVDSAWGGACFGMCATVILAKNGYFFPRQFDSSAGSLSALKPDPAVQSLINYYQCLQQTDTFRNSHIEEPLPGTILRMIRTAKQIPSGMSPFMICFNVDQKSCHAVIGYGCEEGTWNYRKREWHHRILVYDPNHVQFSDADCMYYDPETLEVCIPSYDFHWNNSIPSYTMYLQICNELDVLNCLPYPFAERLGTSDLRGDTDGDRQLTVSDVTLLLDYLLCRGVLSAEAAARADMNGDGRLNAADLSLLKRAMM